MQVFTRPREDVHFTGADTDACGEWDVPVHFTQRGLDLNCGPDGAQCIVFVQLGNAEDGHRRVTDEFLEHPAVVFDRCAHDLEVVGDQPTVDLGVELRGEPRRVDEVTEEHRDSPAVRRTVGRSLAGCSE